MSTVHLPPPQVPVSTPGAVPFPARKRWTCAEFERLWDLGWFEGQYVILINGEILHMAAPNPPHDTATGLADYALKAVFGSGYWVRIQTGLVLGQYTNPIPDIAVVTGGPRDYVKHPTTARLVVEVSDSSLAYDQQDKASLYAAGGIADYWIINLLDRRLEIRRRPVLDPTQPFGYGYADVTMHGPTDDIAPLAAPQGSIRVADLLP